MAREQFQTLTEPMYYILLTLMEECCGVDIMEKVKEISHGRVLVGPGTLYAMLAKFEENDYGTIGCDKNFVHGVKGAFKVFPAVIVDYNAFPVHCQSVDLMDCKHYSNTHSLMCYNECVRREYFFKQRTSPVATVHVDLGSFNPLEDDYEPFAF